MITVYPSGARGHTQIGWLDSYHSFSFGDFYDPGLMGFRALRVINEDRVEPGRGFGTHPHRDMEIISYVIEGALGHKDSLGNGSIITPGEVQRMSAGTGVLHSEMNPSPKEPVHFLQIWIVPERKGIAPGYEQRAFPAEERRGRLRLVASRDGREGSVTIHQDAALYAALLAPGEEASLPVPEGRYAWVQVVRGAVALNDQPLSAGDGAAATEERALRLKATEPSEVLVFDLA
jgi:quercetin 2,3-dioxygenase